jgi:hypothetical protein
MFGFPVPVRDAGNATLSPLCASISPGHVGRYTRFIQKYELARFNDQLISLPFNPSFPYVFALLLAGV